MKEHLYTLTKKDFKIDWFSGTGAGGQHRNRHQNCCRITHIDTGMIETGQNYKERSRNQKEAFQRLAKRVVEYYKERAKVEEDRPTETIRTYHEPDNRVKDHLSGHTQSYKEVVDKGDLTEMIEERWKAKLND